MPRPKEFDVDRALAGALDCFRLRGYEGSSISNLLDSMGISRQSMYDTFGDKYSLFMDSLNLYYETYIESWMGILEAPDASLKEIRQFFSSYAEFLCSDQDRKSCLFANTALEMASTDAQILDMIDDFNERLIEGFSEAITTAIKNGELFQTKAPTPYAKFLTNTFWGMGLTAKTGVTKNEIIQVVNVGLSVLK